jgi:hypothetical protein
MKRALAALALSLATCHPMPAASPPAAIAPPDAATAITEARPVCAKASLLGCRLGADPLCATIVSDGLMYGATSITVTSCATAAPSPRAFEACGGFFLGACGGASNESH